MKKMTVRLIMFCAVLVILTGCGKNKNVPISADETEVHMNGSPAEPAGDCAEKTESERPDGSEAAEGALDDSIKTEAEVDLTREDRQIMASDMDTVPLDTVEYVESDRIEILETRQVETVVDENDPSTYKIIRTEQEVEVIEEIPIEYSDSLGNVKYTFLDGIWYHCQYSSGEITMSDEEDEETVLLLLNMFGDYDDYEVENMECSILMEKGGEPQYAYRVLYRKDVALSEAPSDLENLTVSKTRQNVTTQKVIVEEKVPVTREEKVETGMYIYHGWQELDGDTYYFDKNGEKVTGMQVMNGVRYLFDEHGVLVESSGVNVSSRNGSIDWEAVRQAGIEHAMIRCGYRGSSGGMLIQDARCEENIMGARSAGADTAVWFYSQAVNEKEAVEEADFIVALARKYELSAPLVLATGYSSGLDGRADGLSTEDRTACVEAFCRTVQDAGYTPMIYGEKDWLNNNLDMSRLGDYRLWLAEYNPNITYTGACDIWQYTGTGVIDGISGHTGLSIRP